MSRLTYGTDDMRNALWPSEYPPDIGQGIGFGGHHFVGPICLAE
jgi:hypothetical protein